MKFHVYHEPKITGKLRWWDLQRRSSEMIYGFERKQAAST